MEVCKESDASSNVRGEVRQNNRDKECVMRVSEHTQPYSRRNKENNINETTCETQDLEDEVNSEDSKKTNKTQSNPFQCELCNVISSNAANLRKHLMTHTGEKPYKCSTCNKAFRQPNHLTDHQRIHSGERPYECDVCGSDFIQKSALNRHKKKHKGIRPFSCTECDYSTHEKLQLKAHSRTHTGEKPYQCDKCGETFSSAARLKFHIMIHTGEKRYKCEKCEAAFREKATLETHMAVHLTTIKPFECEECGQEFLRLAGLTLHRRVHQNKKSFRYVHDKEAARVFKCALNEGAHKKTGIKTRSPGYKKRESNDRGLKTQPSEVDLVSSDEVDEEAENEDKDEESHVTSQKHTHTRPSPSSTHHNSSPIKKVLSASNSDSQGKLKENLTSNLSHNFKESCSDVNLDQIKQSLEEGTILKTQNEDGKGFFIVLPPSLKNQELIMMSDPPQCTTSNKSNISVNLEERTSALVKNSSPKTKSGVGSSGGVTSLHLGDSKEPEKEDIKREQVQGDDVEEEIPDLYEEESDESNRDINEQGVKPLDKYSESFEEHIHPDGTSLRLWKNNTTDKLTDVIYIIGSDNKQPLIIQTQEEGEVIELNEEALQGKKRRQTSKNCYILMEKDGKKGRRRYIPMIKVESRKPKIRKVRMGKEYKCSHCGKDCKNSSNYNTHLRTHSGERPYYCGMCGMGFKQIAHLKSHIRIHTGERPYVCTVCSASFTQSSRLNSHKRSAHTEKETRVTKKNASTKKVRNFYCRHCKKTFLGECFKVDHMRMHCSSSYSCTICSKQFKCRKSMERHHMKHSDPKYICELCGVALSILEELHKHKRKEHGIIEPSNAVISVRTGDGTVSNMPNDVFEAKVKVESYESQEEATSVVKEEVIHVTDDGNELRSEVELISASEECSRVAVHDITHMSPNKRRQEHGNPQVNLAKGSNKRISTTLEDDSEVVDEEQKIKKIKNMYEININEHGKKEWVCGLCSRSFKQSSSLHSHMRTHTGERPYQCNLCTEAFRQITHLKDHMNRHTRLMPFRCGTCSRCFIQRTAIRRHIKVKHGGRGEILKGAETNVKMKRTDSSTRDFNGDDKGMSDSYDTRDYEHLDITHIPKEKMTCNHDHKLDCVRKESSKRRASFHTVTQLQKHQKTCYRMNDEGDHLESEMESGRNEEEEEEENLEKEIETVQKSNEDHELSPIKQDKHNATSRRSKKLNMENENKIVNKGKKLNGSNKKNVTESVTYTKEQRSDHKIITDIKIRGFKRNHFKCKECEEVLEGITSYKTHLQGHGGEVKQVCSICGEVFKRASTLRYHQSLKHGREDKRFKDYCPQQIFEGQYDEFEEIVKVKIEVDEDETFTSSDEEEVARKPINNRKLKTTKRCASKTRNSAVRKIPKINTELSEIKRKSINRKDLKNKKRGTSKPRLNMRMEYTEDDDDWELSESSEGDDTEPESSHVCRTCGLRFTQLSKLRLHKGKCKGCSPNQSTVQASDGNEKIRKQKKGDGNGTLNSCELSENVNNAPKIKDKGNTKSSQKSHIEFRCKLCDKLFTDISFYEEHLAIHIRDKPFECEHCSMRFKRKPHLYNHYRRHPQNSNIL